MPASTRGWDVIVVGSGLGGLTCAAYLCACGKRTLVLESHYVAGGNAQSFRRFYMGRHYEFDVGLHYIGECGREGLITRVLRGAGLDGRIAFRPLDPDGFSTLLFPDLTFRVPAGWHRYHARLLETFPEERQGLGRVIDVLREVATQSRRMRGGEISETDAMMGSPVAARLVEAIRAYGGEVRTRAG